MDIFAPREDDQKAAVEWLGSERMDIGCGPNPLPGTQWLYDECPKTPNVRNVNFYSDEFQKIPSLNMYCRHVIEDLRFPEIVLNKAKTCERGWIETPHPFVEYTKKVDKEIPIRGFTHHYWFVWVEDDVLILCPKYSAIEYLPDIPLPDTLKSVNTYYKWKDYQCKYRILKNGIDFSLHNAESYYNLLKRGCNA